MTNPKDEVPWTAGPWRLDDPNDNHCIDAEYHCIGAGAVPPNDGWSQGFVLSGYISAANARLISEAPVMAALLEESVAELSEASNYWMQEDADRVQPLIERARACLARIGRGK